MKIISIDPGYDRVGVAILEKETLPTQTGRNKEKLVYSGCIETSSSSPFHERLLFVGKEISSLIDKYEPKVLAIETLFFNTNQKTAMMVSEARGAIIYQALLKGLKLFEYTPLQIKIAITGYGRSEKRQITSMVKNLIKIEKEIKHDDEYDAIAIGLTYFACNPK